MEQCTYCGKWCKDKKGLATHRRYNKDCYEKWKEDYIKTEESKSYVECKLCGRKLRNISNTHLRNYHNGMTQQEYKEMFPDANIFASGLLEEQKQNRENTMNERYTEAEIKYLQGEKSKQTNLERYGIEHPFQSDKIKEKSKQTNLERYGVENPFQSTEIKEKSKQTNLERYGVEHYTQSYDYKFKCLKTNLEKYGVEHHFKLKEQIEKREKTCLQKYGVKQASKSDIVKQNTIINNITKYGVTNPCKLKEIKEKILNTRRKKYGKYYLITPLFSWESQELFQMIEECINFECYYSLNGIKENVSNEWQVLVNSDKVNHRNLDFYIPKLNKWIEFDEEYHLSEKQQQLDKIREIEIFEAIKGIKLLRVSKEEYINNKLKTLNKCLDFILC